MGVGDARYDKNGDYECHMLCTKHFRRRSRLGPQSSPADSGAVWQWNSSATARRAGDSSDSCLDLQL